MWQRVCVARLRSLLLHGVCISIQPSSAAMVTGWKKHVTIMSSACWGRPRLKMCSYKRYNIKICRKYTGIPGLLLNYWHFSRSLYNIADTEREWETRIQTIKDERDFIKFIYFIYFLLHNVRNNCLSSIVKPWIFNCNMLNTLTVATKCTMDHLYLSSLIINII